MLIDFGDRSDFERGAMVAHLRGDKARRLPRAERAFVWAGALAFLALQVWSLAPDTARAWAHFAVAAVTGSSLGGFLR